jgi:hypothetical protein
MTRHNHILHTLTTNKIYQKHVELEATLWPWK